MTKPRLLRHRCELHARYAPDGQSARAVRVLELSESGAFLTEAAPADCQVGELGALSLALPSGEVLTLRARVGRLGRSRREVKAPGVDNVTVSAEGYGVEFDGLGGDALEALRDYLELLDGR